MPKTIKKRAVKKSDNEGSLAESVTDIRKKIKERQRTLAYSFLVCALVIIAAGSIFFYYHANAAKAAEMQYEGYKIISGTTTEPYASPQDRFKAALEKFRSSYAAKNNPTVLLYIANCYHELGNFDEAIKTLKDLTSRYSDSKITSLAYYKLAMIYIKKGDLNSALNTFNTLSSIKDAPLRDMALFESGKVLESMGKTEEAKAKYKELVIKFPKSPLLNTAKARL